MLKASLKAVFFLLLSMVWHVHAAAQVPQESFNYTQKTEIISLAKSGDADALFKLGIAHLYGVSAEQNDAVAQRFFFYAAQKGHAEASQYLIPTPEIVQTPSLASRTAPAETENFTQKNRADASKPKIAENKAKKVKAKEEIKEENDAAVDQISENVSSPASTPSKDIKLSLAETPKQTKVATATTSPNITLTAPKKRPAIWIYFILAFTALLLMGFIAFKALRLINMRKALPADFDKAAYLDLNPDVRAAGANPVRHFLNHGQHEHRPFKY